ncbi:MAG TPA: plastocyanin/azurin family copper-binding protein [Candidatus Krumholzibacteria bacterium]|nr:plastocyanin/azurin family copper-binding protein [Candidatus Krumholzibacteria bacterium]
MWAFALSAAAVACVLWPVSAPARDAAPRDTVVVEMTDTLEYAPEHATVAVGGTVRWVNPGSVPHTVTADSSKAADPSHVSRPRNAPPFDSGNVGPGESYTRTFEVPGDYTYFCIPHERAGMVGTIRVLAEGEVASDAPVEGEAGQADEEGPAFHLGAHVPPRHDEVRSPDTFGLRVISWLGTFHPPVVHFPIGLLVAAALAELLAMSGRWHETSLHAARFCLWLGAASAVVAAVLGWFFAGFRITDGAWMLTAHRWAGTALAVGAVVVVAMGERARLARTGPRAYRVALFVLAVVVLATGFVGGAMIYGLSAHAWPGSS